MIPVQPFGGLANTPQPGNGIEGTQALERRQRLALWRLLSGSGKVVLSVGHMGVPVIACLACI
jgi:hypothetical protein